MNRHVLPTISLFITFGSVVILSGCYTQVGSTKPEGNNDYYSENDNATQPPATEENVDSTESRNGDYYFDDSGNPHSRYYFSYYYPSFAVGATFYDPWYWGYGGYSYYSPFWCGTYYPALYAGWYHPTSHYYPNGGSYAWGTGRGGHGSTRTIGNTRGSGGSRGRNDSYQGRQNDGFLPSGMSSGASVGRGPAAAKPKVSSGRRTPTNGTRGGTRTGSVRGGNTRTGASRVGPARQPQHAPQPVAPSPEVRSGNRGGDGRSVAPAPSTPPASPQGGTRGGGSRGDTGNSRGGGRR